MNSPGILADGLRTPNPVGPIQRLSSLILKVTRATATSKVAFAKTIGLPSGSTCRLSTSMERIGKVRAGLAIGITSRYTPNGSEIMVIARGKFGRRPERSRYIVIMAILRILSMSDSKNRSSPRRTYLCECDYKLLLHS